VDEDRQRVRDESGLRAIFDGRVAGNRVSSGGASFG
jgi:hypothetical protein